MKPSHPSPHVDHAKYVQGIRKKNALVLDDIYEDCFSEIVGWIMSKGIPEGKAEDLFQDSVEIFIRHCLSEDFVLTCSVRNYLYSVCRNKIREFYRSTDRQVVRISLIEHSIREITAVLYRCWRRSSTHRRTLPNGCVHWGLLNWNWVNMHRRRLPSKPWRPSARPTGQPQISTWESYICARAHLNGPRSTSPAWIARAITSP